jgi:hypothetical protein
VCKRVRQSDSDNFSLFTNLHSIRMISDWSTDARYLCNW